MVIIFFVSVFLFIFGVFNVVLIGFFVVLINVIFYIGFLIGVVFGVFLIIFVNVDFDFYM